MNYTIAELNDVFGEIKINIDKNGNRYTVGIYHKESKEYTHKDFEELTDAYAVFEKLNRAVVMGLYNYDDRKKILTES